MNDRAGDNRDIQKIYSLLLSLKEEITRLSLQIKAIRTELKGVNDNGKEAEI